MDKNLQAIIEKRVERTIKALNNNQFDAHFVRSHQELLEKLDALLPDGSSCGVGGSNTLFETGVIDHLRGRDVTFYDRHAEGVDLKAVFHQCLSSDVYIMSSNAITEDGKLYNIDGRGNRVAALAYGPEKVVIIAGYNKIVPDIKQARARVREIAAPANAIRLNRDTPCTKVGRCMDCKSPGHICSHEIISHYQFVPGRISVFILPGHYGY